MDFLGDIEAFRARHKMTETLFGVLAVNNRGFIISLKGRRRERDPETREPTGRYRPANSPRLVTIEKVYAFMAAYDADPAGFIAAYKAAHPTAAADDAADES